MLAREAIMLKWAGDEPPSISLLKALVSEGLTSITLGYFIDGKISVFLLKWMKLLEALGLNYGWACNEIDWTED